MSNVKDLAEKIQDALENILPKKLLFVIAFVNPEDNDVGLTSNLSDADTIALLQEGIEVIRDPDEVGDLPKQSKVIN